MKAASAFPRRVTLAVAHPTNPSAYPLTLDIASPHADAETACREALRIGSRAFGARMVGVSTPGFGMLAEKAPALTDAYALAR